jgi:hypothetical protein
MTDLKKGEKMLQEYWFVTKVNPWLATMIQISSVWMPKRSKHQAAMTALSAQQNATKTAKFLNNQPLVMEWIRNMWHAMIFQGTVHRSNSGGGFATLIVASFVREGCCWWGGHDTGLIF